jgi:NADPH:quinone reductase-like Zn-dependent oxidoreductase
VRVRAIGVNPFDAAVRSGAMEAVFPTPLPAVLVSSSPAWSTKSAPA